MLHSTLGIAAAVAIASACGHSKSPAPADAGVDAPPPPYQLLAIEPAIANTADTITLEGTFADTAMVTFPGGSLAAATILGPHRATVAVPASATAGDLTVTTGGSTVGPLPFRRASFALGLQTFEPYEQADGARQQGSTITTFRAYTPSVVAGGYLYLVGGYNGTGPVGSLDQATINGDGSLGAFTTLSGVGFVKSRYSHTSVVIGTNLYVLGGADSTGAPLDSIERATINADGSIGALAIVSGVTLVTARLGHTSAVVGNDLYVLGGFVEQAPGGGVTVDRGLSVERATINPDGSLGPFATLPITLATARGNHTSAVIGNTLYVFGGIGTSTTSFDPLDSIEQATINPDGSLGAFVTVSGVTLGVARTEHSSVAMGGYVYILGGKAAGRGTVPDIERAPINPDGSLGAFMGAPSLEFPCAGHTSAVLGNALYVLGGDSHLQYERASIDGEGTLATFATVPTVTLVAARESHTTTAVGDYLYVVGGRRGASLLTNNIVERATINPDGSLGTFAAVPGVTLTTNRAGHSSAVIGNGLYVIGGGNSNGGLTSVERAAINPDGSLGTFATLSGVTLASARVGHTSVMVAAPQSAAISLYVIGGGVGTAVNTVESATLANDGSLSTFAAVAGVTLATARQYATSVVIGSYVYVIGGVDSSSNVLDSVERATINPDGSLGTFAAVTGVTLATARFLHSSAVVGSYLYVVGGANLTGTLDTVERAVINSDGSIGTFATVSGVTLATARGLHTTTVVGNFLYAVGGGNTSNTFGSVEQALLP